MVKKEAPLNEYLNILEETVEKGPLHVNKKFMDMFSKLQYALGSEE